MANSSRNDWERSVFCFGEIRVEQGKESNTGFSNEVQWLGLSTVLKTVSFQSECNDQCHVKYVKINQCRQLALDGVVDTDVHYTLNDADSSPTYYLPFSSVFFHLFFTTLSYKTPIMYCEWRWQSDCGVSNLLTTVFYPVNFDASDVKCVLTTLTLQNKNGDWDRNTHQALFRSLRI